MAEIQTGVRNCLTAGEEKEFQWSKTLTAHKGTCDNIYKGREKSELIQMSFEMFRVQKKPTLTSKRFAAKELTCLLGRDSY
ncbi:hypothetical protein CEXT_682791 [Caerostris extrusa]|uniref:Uncharacterized protein n=1 Tax=Caerostris extrusa TaxID=172846 RepID=A0AAV4QYS4_CAEEX|nr:hypothetical protein CEXT_682791 [Caerostris extrusa]